MRKIPRSTPRSGGGRAWPFLAILLLSASCGGDPPSDPGPASPATAPAASGPMAAVPGLREAMTRGLFHLERFDPDRAAEEFAVALRLAPDLYPALHNRGLALTLARSRPEEAEELLRRAATLEPEEPSPWFILGNLFQRGFPDPREEEALAAFGEAILRAPGDADSWAGKGSALLQLGRPNEALAALGESIRLAPRLGTALYLRAMAMREEGRDEEETAEAFRTYGDLDRSLRLLPREFVYGYLGPLGFAVRDLDPWVLPVPAPRPRPVLLVPGPEAEDPGGPFLLADLDGDGLPDLVTAGGIPGWRRAKGSGGFGELVPFPIPPGRPPAEDAAVGDLDEDGWMDVAIGGAGVVLSPGRGPRLLEHPFAEDAGRRHFQDVDRDGYLDLLVGGRFLRGDGRGGLSPGEESVVVPAPPEPEPGVLARGDLDADGVEDRIRVTVGGIGSFVPGTGDPGIPLGPLRAAVMADLDGDGDLDLLAAGGGILRSWSQEGDAASRSLRITLGGVRNTGGPRQGWCQPRGVGTIVHVHAGGRVLSAVMGAEGPMGAKGTPDLLHFGLGAGKADLVSLLWPEGLVQAEREAAAGSLRIVETQRKTNW